MKLISIVSPLYNEEANIRPFVDALKKVFLILNEKYRFEVIFVNDGSSDNTLKEVADVSLGDLRFSVIDFSRNFGKESATTAGVHAAKGDAVIIIDADLQHPPDLIPDFLNIWEQGAEVVVGVRNESKSDSLFKRVFSKIYYFIITKIAHAPIVPHATDYRLLDRIVVDVFNTLTERNRMTRGLIDWLGFHRQLFYFNAADRYAGTASYSTLKLFKLAINSFVSMSLFPLRLAIYLGFIIFVFSGTLGIVQVIDRYIYSLDLYFSGTGILANITLFLVGMLMMMVGILAVYVGNIHEESLNRPLYIVRRKPYV